MALINITGEADRYAPTLVDGLAAKDEPTRIWVAGALALISGRFKSDLQPLLLKGLKHKEKFVRSIALALLDGLGMDPVAKIVAFSGVLRDEDPEFAPPQCGFLVKWDLRADRLSFRFMRTSMTQTRTYARWHGRRWRRYL